MEAYIRGIGNISPQQSWDTEVFPAAVVEYEGNRLICLEPNYKEYIQPIQMRRMSRTLKMGVAAAGKCLHDAGVEMPDAIIVGTGLGMIADTEKFLRAIIDNGETLLTPTSFIQSTHNTIGAHIAVMLKCNKYNLTYVNDYLSFENALLDSLIRLLENPEEKVLLAGIDEMTDAYFNITQNAGWWKKDINRNLDLYEKEGRGSIAGEGASFFLLSGQPHPDNYARFAGVKTFYRPISMEESTNFIENFLHENKLAINDVDMVIGGMNGDEENDSVYLSSKERLFKNVPYARYKHLSGDYYTASSFAAWLGANILKKQAWPEGIFIKGNEPQLPIRNILIHNQHNNTKHGLILLKAC
ncbi:MAG TPA: beta-ketoacyl synthase chain length factor [Bacteroidales bacterium]|nr:beta-ketoacyl synthase chain length factor [Bacteroidales bacterium]